MIDTNNEINSALFQYFGSSSFDIDISKGGMNNTTCFVRIKGNKYILRIYRSHSDEAKVCYELEVLNALRENNFPLKIPNPITSLEGKPFIRTVEGNIAVVFKYMEGKNPDFFRLNELCSFGFACGTLTKALDSLVLMGTPAYRPYYEIESAYPECPLDKVLEFCRNPPYEFTRHKVYLASIRQQLELLKDRIPSFRDLPHQIIHGDLNASNVLADERGNICGILDFEYVTYDLRAMELAVCLSDTIQYTEGEGSVWERIQSIMNGYKRAVVLEKDELKAIPALLNLRRLDVFVHFLNRYWKGIDGPEVLKKRILNNMDHFKWVFDNCPIDQLII
ncbi:MAG TPA: phosphotransferase [Pseudobacteroides sp.]|uniref:phosphotransferase n=1 Tax=Pseudobacteroides sp. TaxID=1968840 RepID=UPI002F93E326